jgi:hypothetical protein
VKIKIYLGDKQSGNLTNASSSMAKVLNRISKKNNFVVDGDYDYTLGLDGSNAFAKDNIAFIFEPYQVNPRQWDKIKQLSAIKLRFAGISSSVKNMTLSIFLANGGLFGGTVTCLMKI